MLSSSGYSAISSIVPSKVYRTSAERDNRVRTVRDARTAENYDSVTLSASVSGKSRFHMELVGRLSQEVRAATTTGDIHALRQQVSSGEYAPDPVTIARRILFLGEDA